MQPKAAVMGVIIAVAVIVLAIVVVDGILIYQDKATLPAQIEGLAPVGLGGLIGILASTRSTLGKNDVEPTVVNGAIPIERSPAVVSAPTTIVNTADPNTGASTGGQPPASWDRVDS